MTRFQGRNAGFDMQKFVVCINIDVTEYQEPNYREKAETSILYKSRKKEETCFNNLIKKVIHIS